MTAETKTNHPAPLGRAQRLLVIKPSSLGDIMHGLQVVESIRVQRPETEVTWVVAEAFAPVVEACRTVDRVLIFHRNGGIGAFLRLLREIRAERYDCVLDMQGLARSGLMTLAARAERKIGRADSREGARFAYSERIAAASRSPAHAVEILAGFLPALGLAERIEGRLIFDLPEGEAAHFQLDRASVLFFPESRREEKTWPHFDELVRRVAEAHPERCYAWCGAPGIAEKCPNLPNVRNLAGKTGLLDVIRLIQDAAGVVANDSGPIHIAAAVGTPVLALFGPTAPEAYGPFPLTSPNHVVLRADDGKIETLTVEAVLGNLETRFLPMIDAARKQ